jgi:hypothetical protein
VPMKTGVPRMMHSDTPTILSDLPWMAASKRWSTFYTRVAYTCGIHA